MKFLRQALISVCCALACSVASASTTWQEPTADELKMTVYPAAPDAPAVYLFREETADVDRGETYFYARVKILTEKGKEMFNDIEIPYYDSGPRIADIAGRTIHSDGSTIPFTGQPYDKLLIKARGMRVSAKVFSLPDVQVGSILEYRYRLSGGVAPPQWLIQQRIPVLKGHYNFRPAAGTPDVICSSRVPTGDNVVRQRNGSFDLIVENVPALPHEDFLPPFSNLSYRLNFFYSSIRTSDEFWKAVGESWSKDFDQFVHVSDKVRDAANSIVAPADSDEQKVRKIYAAVMKLENTSFTRERSERENKAEHLKEKYAQDIWAQQRGTDDEITRLFVALVRAAGLTAYGAIVVDRDKNLFDPGYLNAGQLDDEVAIVSIDGKDIFFDPGERFCASFIGRTRGRAGCGKLPMEPR
jgi:hypothetical protein